MAKPTEGKRRFAPIPIETTFEQYRKPGTGPAPELTPEPSPRSSSPPSPVFEAPHVCPSVPKEKRRFAPQLIDSSRRSRRAGDIGPATRPVDKTDITPYTNHIYSMQRSRKRHQKITGLARRESCDEETADHVYNLAKKEIEKQKRLNDLEVAMSAFPNSGIRLGGAEHFVVREGSEDDSDEQQREREQQHHHSSYRGRPPVRLPTGPTTRRSRRDSSEDDVSWHVKEAQDAVERRARSRIETLSRIDTRELDEMHLDSPPTDTMWITTSRKETPSPSPLNPIGETHMPLITGGTGHLTPIGETTMPLVSDSPPARPIGETLMPFIPAAPSGKALDMPYIPPETGFQRHGGGRGFGGPFGGAIPEVGFRRNLEADRRKNNNSPPMLGADLVFRRCPSPKQTKMEPDHLWKDGAEEVNRDPTGQKGLWRGYCYTAEGAGAGTAAPSLAPLDRPLMISTPMIPSSTFTDPFSVAFGGTTPAGLVGGLSEEPTPIGTPRQPTLSHSAGPTYNAQMPLHPHHPHHPLREINALHGPASKQRAAAYAAVAETKSGLHMLMGLDERLRKEKAAADLEEQIQAEFTDRFVTQVYNYLSLGYPAMAWSYDEELSKISRIPVSELRRDDDAVMDGVVAADHHHHNRVDDGNDGGAKKNGVVGGGSAKGHIKLTEDDDTREQDRCPRWKALKLYVHEWARQHPDLESISPLAWGVRERRGSWGV